MEQVNLQQPAASPGRILVVDDDASVGLALRLALKPFQVTFAQSASGALARVQAGADFQAVVCDLHMPGMSGMQFQEQLRAIDYGLADRIVFVTGGAQTAEAAAFLQRTMSLWLEKPFQREALQAAVTAAAARHPPR